MTTATHHSASPTETSGLLGETVHYRDADRCWAAAVVARGPSDTVQLYLFPLPPAVAMPSNPGTYLHHDGGTTDETWHRLAECAELAQAPPRKRGRRRASARASA